MDKPEFRKLLNEYMDAMQDPETKKEEEEYLKQLEREAEEGNYQLQILLPEPAFCVKCRNRARDKVYINICTSEKVEVFREDYTGQSRNATWHVPLSIGKPRTEMSKKGKAIETYDAVFHPKTVRLANDSAKFMCFLVEICVEHINEGYQKALVPEFQRLGKVASKGKPAAQSIRVKTNDPDAPPVAVPGMPTSGMSTINMLPSRPAKAPPPEAVRHPPIPSAEKPAPAKPKPKPKGALEATVPPPPQWVQPEYRLVHRGDASLGDAWNQREDLKRRLPKELVLTVDLPLMTAASEADSLEITGQRVFLRSEKRGYYLDLHLPFPVNEDKCSAKFDKARRTLNVIMAVQPPEKPELQRLLEEKEAERAAFEQEAQRLAAEEAAERDSERRQRLEQAEQARAEKARQEAEKARLEEERRAAAEALERRLAEEAARQAAAEREAKLKAVAERTRLAREAQAAAAAAEAERQRTAAEAERGRQEAALQRRLEEQREAERLEGLLREKEAAVCLRNRFIFEID